MSLRTIHLIFIASSIILAVMVTLWGVDFYLSERGSVGHLLFSTGSLGFASGMIAYLVVFIKKTRAIGME